ncbi:hypothetical protein [Streptomyces sp. WM6378]|uniref:hypothetical protein n=1 Tax=Streptomyces sp. WM6378 TaxID=1415557 RepID=UPI0006C0B3F8|nr:hypothetical protein [Streptomyces sp. WM6378]KOU35036.1 hypothetical protein ADK54_38135 [Streptomyces sp. WM6378]
MRSIRRTVTVAVLTAVVLCTASLTPAFADDDDSPLTSSVGGLGGLGTGADALTRAVAAVAGLG